MRFLLITRTWIYKRFINRRPEKNSTAFRAFLRYGLEAVPLPAAGKDSYITLLRLIKCHLFTPVTFTLFQITGR